MWTRFLKNRLNEKVLMLFILVNKKLHMFLGMNYSLDDFSNLKLYGKPNKNCLFGEKYRRRH